MRAESLQKFIMKYYNRKQFKKVVIQSPEHVRKVMVQFFALQQKKSIS
jgi:hypothetical protein